MEVREETRTLPLYVHELQTRRFPNGRPYVLATVDVEPERRDLSIPLHDPIGRGGFLLTLEDRGQELLLTVRFTPGRAYLVDVLEADGTSRRAARIAESDRARKERAERFRCLALATVTGERCKVSSAGHESGFCRHHRAGRQSVGELLAALEDS
jgi:hypothetical protein